MTTSDRRDHRSGSGVPGYLGYLLIALGLAAFLQVGLVNGRIALLGESAEGTVVRVERSQRPRGPNTPVVEFTTNRGEVTVFKGFSQRRTPYAPGGKVRVRYLPSQPGLAEIDSWPTLWRALVVALVVGAGLTIGGVLIVRSAARRKRQAA